MVVKNIAIFLISLLISSTVFGYVLPFKGAEHIYFNVQKKYTFKKINFQIDDKKYEITTKSKSDSDILINILSNLFLGDKSRLSYFTKKNNISISKSHYELIDDIPTVVYGAKDKKENVPQIWLQFKKFYPIKIKLKLDNKDIECKFIEYNNRKLGYSFPTKIELSIDGEKKTYQISNITY